VEEVAVKHEQIADYMLMNRGTTQKEVAKHFGVTPVWISRVVNTDLFKDYFRERHEEIKEAVKREIVGKAGGVVNKALTALGQKIEQQGSMMKTRELLDTVETVGNVVGIGGNHARNGGGQQPAVVVQVGGVDKGMLAEARERMHRQREGVEEAELVDSAPAIDSDSTPPSAFIDSVSGSEKIVHVNDPGNGVVIPEDKV
jgi:predicted transcriptional regulator